MAAADADIGRRTSFRALCASSPVAADFPPALHRMRRRPAPRAAESHRSSWSLAGRSRLKGWSETCACPDTPQLLEVLWRFFGRALAPADAPRPQIFDCLVILTRDHGGEGGIRTLDTLASMPHFECGAFNHSATSPDRHGRRGRQACSPRPRCDQGLPAAHVGRSLRAGEKRSKPMWLAFCAHGAAGATRGPSSPDSRRQPHTRQPPELSCHRPTVAVSKSAQARPPHGGCHTASRWSRSSVG